MSVTYKKVEVRRSELHSVHETVPAWEVPLLQAAHEGAIEELETLQRDREAPSPQDEYLRLEQRYGVSHTDDGSIGPLFVAMVYGQGALGIKRLSEEMSKAVTASKSAAEMV